MQGYNLIVVFDERRERVLLCRRRKEPYKGLLNFVGGKIEPGEEGLAAAYRELREETGLEAGQLILLAALCSSPDVLAETLYLYWAQDLRQAEARLAERPRPGAGRGKPAYLAGRQRGHVRQNPLCRHGQHGPYYGPAGAGRSIRDEQEENYADS